MEDCALAADVSCFGSRPAMVPSRLALKVSSLQIDMADPICWSGANRDIYSTWSGNSTLLCPLINQMILKREEPFNPQALALLFNPLKVSGTPRQDTQDPWALRKKRLQTSRFVSSNHQPPESTAASTKPTPGWLIFAWATKEISASNPVRHPTATNRKAPRKKKSRASTTFASPAGDRLTAPRDCALFHFST